jgi:DNA-directed RNA polymerase omega subunit
MFKLPENVESKYRFVMLSALRAEQLQLGAIPRVDSMSTKATVVAQEEVAEGLIEAWDGTQPEPAAPVAPAEE